MTGPDASKPDLLHAFFTALPDNAATEFPDEAVAICSAVVEEFRRRGREKQHIEHLRDSHALEHELRLTFLRVQDNESRRLDKMGLITATTIAQR